ncbi:MAG: hypothetical protein F4X79_04155 [Acidobacteria bacterium]|nr:hypothetical protein [Acidobacteriota bacterium]
MPNTPEIAYYYPAPFWRQGESDWVKSLLLFFDKVSVLLPNYMYGIQTAADPSLAGPLEERGLLQVLRPETWIDQEMADQLAEITRGLLAEGVFDNLPKDPSFVELSRSRMGDSVDVRLTDSLVEALKRKGLARPSEDGVSIPLHPTVRTTILVILSQLSRISGVRRGMHLHPATRDRRAIRNLGVTLSQQGMPSYGRVVKLDLEAVSFDLSSVPLDDVLQFRVEHARLYREYIRGLQACLFRLSSIPDTEEREAALRERRKDIIDSAADVRRETARAFGHKLGSWSLGIAGAAWSAVSGDVWGVLLAAAGLARDALDGEENGVSAYSYLFAAEERWG